jgi:hypothetical protein
MWARLWPCPLPCSAGSYTAPHVDFYGTDAYLYLVSGEKLWFLAPPEQTDEFMRLFKRDDRGATIRLSKEQKDCMEQHHMSFIHQRAGDVVFVPAGWPHMVKNLSATVSFGNSYLRPWNMPLFLAFVQEQGLEDCSSLLNVRGIIEAWMSDERQREWGVTPEQAQHVMHQWGKHKIVKLKPSSHTRTSIRKLLSPAATHRLLVSLPAVSSCRLDGEGRTANEAAHVRALERWCCCAAAATLRGSGSCLVPSGYVCVCVCVCQAQRHVCAQRSSAEVRRCGSRLSFVSASPLALPTPDVDSRG